MIAVILPVAALMGVASLQGWVLTMPTTLVDGERLLFWVATTVLAPHILLYAFGVATALWILPESTIGYSWWLLIEGRVRVGLVLLMMQALVLGAAGVTITQASQLDLTSVATGYSAAQANLWNLALLSMLVPTWIGYRTGWRVYRDVGARTERQRQEDHLRKLEIKHSGQPWDRYVERPFRWITGMDGHKPRWFLIWAVLSMLSFMFIYALSLNLNSQYLFGMGVFATIPSMTALVAAWTKFRDGAMTRRLPFLIPVRDAEHDDPYDPRSAGVKTFTRS